MLNIQETPDGVRIEVKALPRSSKNQVQGEQDGALKVKLAAAPVDGEANQALVKYLASYLDIPRRNVVLLKGESSRNKVLEIKGLSREALLGKLKL